jgi:sterol desaturase/sphingolipid hydroxylase (fatty acid hydroxylase superfamily)
MNYLALTQHYLQALGIDVLRYALFAGIPYVLFYMVFKSGLFRFKIQQKYPAFQHIRREVLYSLSSMAIFTIVAVSVGVLQHYGYTRIYTDIHQHSIAYFVFSIFAFIFLHDAYFYWSHRLMHHKKIYKHVHLIHHKSINPTPWAAYAFHPYEAVMQVLILPIMVFLIPLHPLAILVWGLYQSALNVGGHLGFEVFRKGFTERLVTKWHNTSTHHNMHHKYVNCNYGLYFNIWDRIMGTNHQQYTTEFEAICERRGSILKVPKQHKHTQAKAILEKAEVEA